MDQYGLHLLFAFSFLFVVSSFISGVNGIKCFQCNSMVDAGCPNIQPNQTDSIFYKPCSGDYKGKVPFCRKIEQKIFDRDDMVRVVRKCGYERHDRLDCYQLSNDDHTETICQCFTDACNGAVSTSGYSLSFVLLCSSFLFIHNSFVVNCRLKNLVFAV